MTPEDRLAGLKQRLRAWIDAHHLSDRKFAGRVGKSESTIYRILTVPPHRGDRETWRAIARTCGWDEDEVLGLAGFQAAAPTPVDPWTLVTQGLTQLGVSEARQVAVRQMLGLDAPATDPNRPGRPSSERNSS